MPQAPPIPTMGRIVMYVATNSPMPLKILPAVVVKNQEGNTINLQVFQDNTSGTDYVPGVTHDENKSQGSWHWPERI